MISGIRHIIFDLGGVLLNIDYQATERAFEKIGIADFRQYYSQLAQNNFFDKWETGRISQEAFIAGMRKASGNNNLTAVDILHAWNAMLLDFPIRRLQLLQQLRIYYDLFLLSNTNEVHETAFNEILMRTCGIASIGHFFDRAYFSHRMGLRKPDTEIFKWILNENGLAPEHTLFIDDSLQHIEAAKSLGIQTIFLGKGMTIEADVFRPL